MTVGKAIAGSCIKWRSGSKFYKLNDYSTKKAGVVEKRGGSGFRKAEFGTKNLQVKPGTGNFQTQTSSLSKLQLGHYANYFSIPPVFVKEKGSTCW